MNKLSHLRFGSVPKLLAGIWLTLGLMIMLSVNAYAQTPGTLTVVMELAGDPAPSPLPAFDVVVDGATVLSAPGSFAVDAAAGGQTFIVGQQTLPGPEWRLRVACSPTAGLQTPNGDGTINVPVSDGETVTCTVTNEYTAPEPTEAPSTVTDPTIAEIAESAGFDTLVAALDAAGLTSTFADPDAGPFTVFAPTDEAFAALPDGVLDALLADPTGALTQILQYHVVDGVFTSTDLVALTSSLTTLLGEEIEVSVVNESLTLTFLNGSSVVVAGDIEASNGIIHVIDTVLLPPPPEEPTLPTIADIAIDGGFSTLVAALNAAGLTDLLADPDAGPFTVFAPTNDAFAALPDGVLDALLADPAALTEILQYHVVDGVFTSTDLAGLTEGLTTLLGEEITVSVVDGSLVLTFLNGKSVILSGDIEASNGIVHVIDTVLIPPSELEPTPTIEPTPTPLPDADGDGIPDALEDANRDGDPTNDDADGDGTPNYLDLDSNNDGVPDSAQFDADGDGVVDDSDGDGIPDYLDLDSALLDSNGNGVPDGEEYDKDGDGIGDDADGDGIPDYLDTDPVDTNGNGIPDGEEYDADGDGIVDDVDGDGIPDWLDDFVAKPSISVLKAVQSSREVPNGTLGTLLLPALTAGETIVFIIGVENTGNVPLTDVNVMDILPGADATDCTNTFPATLDAGENMTCVVTYVITDDDVNNGEVVNEAIVQSQYEGVVVENSAISVFPSTEPQGPLTLRKFVSIHDDIDQSGDVTAGDVLNYVLVATNVGDSTLSGVVMSDLLAGTSALICNRSGTVVLDPDEELTCRTEYEVTTEDAMVLGDVPKGEPAGFVINTAFATADGPFAVAVQVDNTDVFAIASAVNLANNSIMYSATFLLITIAAVTLAQLTSYATRKEL